MDVVRLPVIVGPTAAGKSAVALFLAAGRPLTIISADSRQVYRGFDVGTAKPSRDERERVPHALIDVVDPVDRYGAARWADDALVAVADARAAGRMPLVVGGTGLYLRALFTPLFHEPPLDAVARRALELELAARPTEDLRLEVQRLDPERAHLGRTQLLRAIEIARLTGTSLTTWHARAPRQARVAPTVLVVERGAQLGARIEARVDAMFAAGWVAEIERLSATVPDSAPAWNAMGYEAVRQVVRGEQSLAQARERVVIATRQYAKRQRTWFRHQLDPATVTRLDLGDSHALDRAMQWWRAQELT